MSKKWTIHRLTVPAELNAQRLDIFLSAAGVNLSRTFAKKIVDLGGVHVNGRRVRSCSLNMKTGDLVEVYIDHLPVDPYRLREGDVVFHDQYLIVLNKPAFVDTQPTHARYKGTLYEALQWHLKDPRRPQKKQELGMIQRLDRGTSGLIAFSIHPRAHKKMTEVFVEHQVRKRYLALVAGRPDPAEAEIRSFLARTRNANKVMSVAKGGKEAITRYRVKKVLDGAALVEVDLLTGRSHQIRAHLSEQGHPLLGDDRYGGPSQIADIEIERPLLHAAELSFAHPVSGDQLEFSVPLPEDMTRVINGIEIKS
jgi:23S rRNA pseudouridine1911/1915/1917 synthase